MVTIGVAGRLGARLNTKLYLENKGFDLSPYFVPLPLDAVPLLSLLLLVPFRLLDAVPLLPLLLMAPFPPLP
jgi:hypothetical protein